MLKTNEVLSTCVDLTAITLGKTYGHQDENGGTTSESFHFRKMKNWRQQVDV